MDDSLTIVNIRFKNGSDCVVGSLIKRCKDCCLVSGGGGGGGGGCLVG